MADNNFPTVSAQMNIGRTVFWGGGYGAFGLGVGASYYEDATSYPNVVESGWVMTGTIGTVAKYPLGSSLIIGRPTLPVESFLGRGQEYSGGLLGVAGLVLDGSGNVIGVRSGLTGFELTLGVHTDTQRIYDPPYGIDRVYDFGNGNVYNQDQMNRFSSLADAFGPNTPNWEKGMTTPTPTVVFGSLFQQTLPDGATGRNPDGTFNSCLSP
jgi:hypothetical protein